MNELSGEALERLITKHTDRKVGYTYVCPICGDTVLSGRKHIGSVFCRLRSGDYTAKVAQVTAQFKDELDALEAACRLVQDDDTS